MPKFVSIVVVFLTLAFLSENGLAKNIVDLQKFRQTNSIEIPGKADAKGLTKLTNLNIHINAWFLLEIKMPESNEVITYHIENPRPYDQNIRLTPDAPAGIKIIEKAGFSSLCDFSAEELTKEVRDSVKKNSPYTAVCDDRLYVRNKTSGHQTAKEFITEFLRNNVWGGEQITSFVKETFFKDKFLLKSNTSKSAVAGVADNVKWLQPREARLEEASKNTNLEPQHLGIVLKDETEGKLVAGSWYEAKDVEGVFVSVVQPKMLAPEIMLSYPKKVAKLDSVERSAMAYLVAFDLQKYDMEYTLGTTHPEVNWSPRALDKVKDPSIPGPDGIENLSPLVATGKINPRHAKLVVGSFTGGFKRTHGAFKWGRLSQINFGSHYGFIENGVIASTLQPGLATVIIGKNGAISMKTWSKDDDTSLLPSIKHARQNGVPIIEGFDGKLDAGIPGGLVNRWGQGNWSGSIDSKQRALRAGFGLQRRGGRQFLIYGYFSSATPSAMARVFQAYGVNYAFHLDMNALEHTYLAIYNPKNAENSVQHLIKGMDVLDSTYKGKVLPRFVGMADNRDFFYLIKKQ